MSRRRRQTLSPTLFPFLAVLVCTLGTLILLLALVAQNASDTAQQIADTPVEEPVDMTGRLTVGEVSGLVDEEEFRLEELVSFRDAQTGDLENRRDELAHLEDHTRRIRERLKEIGDAMESAFSQQPTNSMSEAEVKQLKEQLETKEKAIEKLREEIKTAKPRFVIVPHQGPNGTSRRPIYLECTAEGVTIWPEGVSIKKWQLEGSNRDANPLDDALRAARYHALQEYGDAIPPYPMLIVRPQGVDTYYAARAAMLDWDDQFGYELVPSAIELAYPKPDAGMRQRMEYAVKEAVDRISRQSIARSIAGRGQGSRYPGATTSGGNSYEGNSRRSNGSGQEGYGKPSSATTGNGYASSGNGPAKSKKVPRLSVSQMDRQGRQSGFRDHRMFPSRTYANSRTGGGSHSISPDAAKRRLERQLQDSASSFDEDGVGTNGERQLDRTAETALNHIANGRTGSGVQQMADQPSHQPQSGEQGSDSPMLMPPSNFDAAAQTQNSQDGNYEPGYADQGGRPRPGSEPNTATKNDPSTFGKSGRAMTSMSQQQNFQQAPSQRQANTTSSQSSSQRPRPGQPPSAGPGTMVQRSGADWALPSSVALGQGNEIVRPIRVAVYADRLVLTPSAGARVAQSFPIEPNGINVATLQMATAVRDRIKRWGAAAPGARWSPRLKVDVMPGAEQRFVQLERLMTGSGLEIQRGEYRRADAVLPLSGQGGTLR